jgi:hypothetical protein
VSAEGRTLETGLAPIANRFYPPPNIVCAGQVSGRCAQRAADRAGFPVAWLPAASSPHLSVVAIPAERVRVVMQHGLFLGTLGAIEIASPSIVGPPDSPVVRVLHAHGLRATLRRPVTDEPIDQVVIDWSYRGRRYEMTAFAVFRDYTEAQIDELARTWTTLRYALPS